MTSENKVWYLRHNRLFEHADDGLLRDTLHLFNIVRHPPRKRLFDQGAPVGCVYLVKEGRIALSRVLENGKQITIAVLAAGDVFGEEGIFGIVTRKTQATTVDSALICTARAEDLFSLMSRQPTLSLNMARYLHEQRDEAVSAMEGMAYLKVSERLSRLMQRLADEHGIVEGSDVRIDLPLTHADIASLIGSTRETVSVEMARLVKLGTVLVRDHVYVLSGRAHAIERQA